MASLFKLGSKYYIAYKLNGRRITKSTGLEYTDKNKFQAEAMKKEIVTLEKENKMKIKYGAIVPKTGNESIKLSEAKALYLNHIKKNRTDKKDYHTRVFEVTFRQFSKIINPERRISTISKEDIIKFRNSIWNELSNATVRTYLRYLKGFFNYLIEYDYLDKTPVRKGINPKAEIKPIIIFEENHLNIILEKAKQRDIEYYKIYKMLLLTAIRPCDLFTLKAGDFNLSQNIIQFKISKTNRTLDFPMYNDLKKFIDQEFQEIKSMSRNEIVFKKYNVIRIGKTFRKILKESGLTGDGYNLKTFRKTFASGFADKGLSEGDVADLLGHTSISTTRQYYKRKNAGAIRNRINSIG